MGKPLPSGVGVCSMCGKPLKAKGDCLACLLRTGLDHTAVESKPTVLPSAISKLSNTQMVLAGNLVTVHLA
jgi:hypothetical protein